MTVRLFSGHCTFIKRWRISYAEVPTPEQLTRAHELFEQNEPRWRDYWLATEGVENGFRAGNVGDVAAAITTLLKSWHKEYYHWRPQQAAVLQADLQQLIAGHLSTIQALRTRSLTTLTEDDRSTVLALFASFEQKLDQVGTAKSLNLLAPKFFPLWDSSISYGYGVVSAPHGYFLFMVVVKDQVRRMKCPTGLDPLKTLDEYNYCKYTKNWLP